MLSCGYCKFSRGWRHDPASPFNGAKRRQYYEVWRELCEQAAYDDSHGAPIGTISITLSELVESTRIPRVSVVAALKFCKNQKLITVVSRLPTLTLRIAHYESLESVSEFLGKIEYFKNSSGRDRETRPVKAEVKDSISLVKTCVQKIIPTGDIKTRPQPDQQRGVLSMRNDRKKDGVEKPTRPQPDQFRDILKNNNTELLYNSSVGAANAAATPKPKSTRKPRAVKQQPTEWQIRVGTFWANHLATLFSASLVSTEKQIAGIQAVQAKAPDLDEAQVELVLLWATTHRHWKRALLNLGGLLTPYRFADGAPKLVAMLADMDAERGRQSNAAPKRTWAGEEV